MKLACFQCSWNGSNERTVDMKCGILRESNTFDIITFSYVNFVCVCCVMCTNSIDDLIMDHYQNAFAQTFGKALS